MPEAIVKVFVASSSELKAEREAIRLMVSEKNESLHPSGTFLQMVLWETLDASVSATRKQDDYNRHLGECQLCVVVVRSKVGRYTEEEFDVAVQAFKRLGSPKVLTYFMVASDAEPSVAAFEQRLRTMGHFPVSCANTDALLRSLATHIDRLIPTRPTAVDPTRAGGVQQGSSSLSINAQQGGHLQAGDIVNTGGGASIRGAVHLERSNFVGRDYLQVIVQNPAVAGSGLDVNLIEHYLEVLCNDVSGLPLGAYGPAATKVQPDTLNLEAIYVPLNTRASAVKPGVDEELERSAQESTADERPVSALEALARHRRMVLLGLPGSGKSSFGAHVLLTMAQAFQGNENALASWGDIWRHGLLMPIHVRLRSYAQTLAQQTGTRKTTVWQYIAQELETRNLSSLTVGHLELVARTQGALFVFDGLDECGDAETQCAVRAILDSFVKTAPAKCRFLLTARPSAWVEGIQSVRGEYELAEFNNEQVAQFVDAWCSVRARHGRWTPAKAAAETSDLLQAVQRTEMGQLASSPLLLTQMAVLHSQFGRLPYDRATLYDETVKLLLARWSRQSGADTSLLQELDIPSLQLTDCRTALEDLAFESRLANLRNGIADMSESDIRRAFLPLVGGSWDKAERVVSYIEHRAGLLIGHGPSGKYAERKFSFPHPTYQEYLAACHLARQSDFESRCVALADEAAGHWQVVLPLAARISGPDRGTGVADRLVRSQQCHTLPPEAARKRLASAMLAAAQLKEIGDLGGRADGYVEQVRARVASWLLSALPSHSGMTDVTVRQSIEAGDLLAELGDARFDAARGYLPADEHLGFEYVPAQDGYVIGTRAQDAARVAGIAGVAALDAGEINDAPVETWPFHIGRYLVTTAQFRAFVQASGRQPQDLDALRGAAHLPVRWVSWHEALAYCSWLEHQLRHDPEWGQIAWVQALRGGDFSVILPSELEWEVGARAGRAHAIFPWGDAPDAESANTADLGQTRSTAVGCFAPNALGLYDMVGNVWEWTRSHWGIAYPYMPNDRARENLTVGADVRRVVRGGAFYDGPRFARCAFRGFNLPDARSIDLGFRVVVHTSSDPALGARASK